jgi:hypothetical protein
MLVHRYRWHGRNTAIRVGALDFTLKAEEAEVKLAPSGIRAEGTATELARQQPAQRQQRRQGLIADEIDVGVLLSSF